MLTLNRKAGLTSMLTSKEDYKDYLVKENTNRVLYTALKNGSRVDSKCFSIMNGGNQWCRDKVVKAFIKQANDQNIPVVHLKMGTACGETICTDINYDPFADISREDAVHLFQDMAEVKGLNRDDLYEPFMDMVYSCEEPLSIRVVTGMNNRSIGFAAFQDYNDTVAASMTTKESKQATSLIDAIGKEWEHTFISDEQGISLSKALSTHGSISIKAYKPLILCAALTELESMSRKGRAFLIFEFPTGHLINEKMMKYFVSVCTQYASFVVGENLPGVTEELWNYCSRNASLGIYFRPVNEVAAIKISELFGEKKVEQCEETTAETNQKFSLFGGARTKGYVKKTIKEAVMPQEKILGLRDGEAIVSMRGMHTTVSFL